MARRDRKGSLNDGRIQNPSNTFGIVPLFNFVPRGFGFVHHSIAILYHEVPNPNLTIRNLFIAVGRQCGGVGSWDADVRFCRYRLKFQSNLVWDSIKPISNFCFQFSKNYPIVVIYTQTM
jgi:hypothetical protein